MTLDYFYGQAGELFSFFRIPKALFQEQRFQDLSTDAKTLYGILLDRMSLSVKNEWFDKKGRVFIIFTIEDVKRSFRCADNKATRLLRELEEFGLIERKRRGQGKPGLVYVKNFSAESSKESVKNRDNDDSNLQRENILPSERAFACKMKLEALKNQGARSDLTSTQLAAKFRSDDAVAKDQGISGDTVRRYIRMGKSMGLPCRTPQIGVLRLSGKRFEPSIRKKRKIFIPTWVYSCCVRHEENRSENCCIVFPQMGVSRMGYGYCNIIYGQIRQKSLIFFVYL